MSDLMSQSLERKIRKCSVKKKLRKLAKKFTRVNIAWINTFMRYLIEVISLNNYLQAQSFFLLFFPRIIYRIDQIKNNLLHDEFIRFDI